MSLHFERFGEGPRPVVLLHGFMGSSAAWAHLRPLLSPHVMALAVDLPGHGRSAQLVEEGREGFDQTLAHLDALVERELGGLADVVGYSQGARLALAFAAQRPGRVRRLVLESGSPGLHARKLRSLRRAEDEARAQTILLEGVTTFVRGWEQHPVLAGLSRLPDPLRSELRSRREAQSAEGLAWALRSLGTGVQPDLWPALPHLRAPTLLLTGSDDVKYTELARKMAAEIPTVWRHAFAGVGHAPHLEVPAAWAHEVVGFLSTPWYDVVDADPVEAAETSGR